MSDTTIFPALDAEEYNISAATSAPIITVVLLARLDPTDCRVSRLIVSPQRTKFVESEHPDLGRICRKLMNALCE